MPKPRSSGSRRHAQAEPTAAPRPAPDATLWVNRVVDHGVVKVADLVLNPANWKTHTPEQLRTLLGTIRSVGFIRSLMINRITGNLLDGHGRVILAQAEGVDELPVEYVEVDPEREAEVIALFDPISGMIKADKDKLDELLRSVRTDDAAVMEALSQLAEEHGVIPPDEKPVDGTPGAAAEPEARVDQAELLREKWAVEPGQIWEIPSATVDCGKHRILCGDATSPADFDRLMGGRKAKLVHTDPPYGVAYESAVTGSIQGDKLNGDALVGLILPSLKNCVRHTDLNAPFYVWHASSTRKDFEWAMIAAGLRERQYLIWVKETFVLGHADYHWQHEPCFYAVKAEAGSVYFTPERHHSTVWRLASIPADGTAVALANGLLVSDGSGNSLYVARSAPKNKKLRSVRIADGGALALTGDDGTSDTWEIRRDPMETYLHPTQKPAEIAGRAVENSSQPGDIVLDCFHGGGGTMVGAEQRGRLCYAMDLEPKFVAVALERMSQLGLEPRLATA